ncbi:MAG: hypothetical protein K8S20_07000 [Chloroflexi bacterium]|nr:hypothetical protein [Chloroflexota bacterium]
MNRYLFVFTIIFMSLLAACGPQHVDVVLATQTPVPPATGTPTLKPVPDEFAFLPDQLEIIQPGNLMRLQLLKTYPAEIPLQNSAVAISPDGRTLAVGSSSTAAILFIDLAGVNSSRKIQVDTGFQGPFDKIEYLADGTILANSTTGYQSYHLDPDGNLLARWGYPAVVSPDGKVLAYADNAGTVLVDVNNDQILGSLEGNVVLSLSFSPDGSRLAVATAGVDYLTCHVWDVVRRTLLATLNDAGDVRFSPDGKFLAVTGIEGDLTNFKIFDADGKTQLQTLSAPQGLDGSAPLLSPDGQMIFSQIPGGTPVAWETNNWQSLALPVLQGSLDSFSPDGRILITRTSDGGILLWGIFS